MNDKLGIMPDSVEHIARLESKLKKLEQNKSVKKDNSINKLSGKNILESMNDYRQMFMMDLNRNDQNSVNLNAEMAEYNSIILESIDKSYLEVIFLEFN
jgi:hypothetical protein